METEPTTGGEAFAPTPLSDILRPDAEARPAEPVGRPEPEAAQQAPAETGEQPAPEPKAPEQPRTSDGKFAPKDAAAAPAGPPPAEQAPPQMVPVAAVLEERKKRQALEGRMRELEQRLAAPQPPQAPAQPQQPDVPLEDLMFQDPQRFVQAVRAPLEEQLVHTRLVMSEQVARTQPDYAEAEAALVSYVEANPQIKQQVAQALRAHPAPAMWALEQGRALLRQQQWGSVIRQYGSPEAYAEAMRAAQPVPPAAAPEPSPSPPAPPGSLANVRAAGPRAGAPPWRGPTPLSAILGRR